MRGMRKKNKMPATDAVMLRETMATAMAGEGKREVKKRGRIIRMYSRGGAYGEMR